MDCEKFESTLLDELYEELDEVTSAAAKRHVGGCSRCAALLSGFKATRRVAVLPIVEPPADLEDRILAAAKEAQKVVPLERKVSHAISMAGSWAMRPQNAMAALFLLMLGSSALLLKGKHAAPPSTMTVSEEGEPVASATAGTVERPAADLAAAPTEAKGAMAAGQPLAPAPTVASAPAASAYGGSDSVLDGLLARGRSSGAAGPAGKINAPPPSAPSKEATDLKDLAYADNSVQNAAPVAGAPAARHAAQAPGAGGGGLGGSQASPPPQAKPSQDPNAYAQKSAPATRDPSSFDSAMGAYNTGDYGTAATLFDQVAANGDLNAALWAARSVREGSGCQQAASRFDQVARAGTGTTAGYDAMFDGGRCYKLMGQSDRARAMFNVLLGVPSYVNRAKSELAGMGPMVAQKAQKAAPPQSTATQQAPAASPPPKAVDQAY